MNVRRIMPGPCVLCGHARGIRADGRWECHVCGWRVGDVPDPDLPRPRIDIVYYIRWRDRIKIGTTHRPRGRLAVLQHEELLAFERGDRTVERERHRQFAGLREGGEWFTAAPELVAHARGIAGGVDPWDAYSRWVGEALRATLS